MRVLYLYQKNYCKTVDERAVFSTHNDGVFILNYSACDRYSQYIVDVQHYGYLTIKYNNNGGILIDCCCYGGVGDHRITLLHSAIRLLDSIHIIENIESRFRIRFEDGKLYITYDGHSLNITLGKLI